VIRPSKFTIVIIFARARQGFATSKKKYSSALCKIQSFPHFSPRIFTVKMDARAAVARKNHAYFPDHRQLFVNATI
jgi:hypothetical protein